MNQTPINRQPQCLIITGRPGAGKTTLASQLSKIVRMPLISRDEIKEGYVRTFDRPHNELPSETNRIVTDLFFETARSLLKAQVSLILEAAFQHKLWAEFIPTVTDFSRPRIIICDVDPDLCARRHLQRGLDDPDRERFHGDHRVTHYRQTGEILPPGPWQAPDFNLPTITIDTSHPLETVLPKALQFAGEPN